MPNIITNKCQTWPKQNAKQYTKQLPNNIPNKCQTHARQIPNKCKTIYQTNA